MKHKTSLLLAAAAVLLFSGCQKQPPDTAEVLAQAQQALSDLDSYSLRMTVDIRATPENGDGVSQPSFALDTYSQFTDGCKAMYRSAQYTVYQDWNWFLSSSEEYQFPGEAGGSEYYYSCDGTQYFRQERETVDYSLDLASYFGDDVTAAAVRYEGQPVYLLSGSLANPHFEQLLPPDGAVAQLLQQIPITATVNAYLDSQTMLPMSMEITCIDSEGAILEELGCTGGELNICRISLHYSSFNQLTVQGIPEELSEPTLLDDHWRGPQQNGDALLLQQGSTFVEITIPVTDTLSMLASTNDSLFLQKTSNGNHNQITYRLVSDDAFLSEAASPVVGLHETVTDIARFRLEPLPIAGRTVSGEYTTYLSTDDDGKENHVALYSLWTPLEHGTYLQCIIRNSTNNKDVFVVDAAGFVQQYMASIR